LPPRTLILRKDRFDEREDDFYQALYTQCEWRPLRGRSYQAPIHTNTKSLLACPPTSSHRI